MIKPEKTGNTLIKEESEGECRVQQVYVKFRNAEQVRQFVNVIDRFDASFDMGSGRRVVDAKSILGVCALDLREPQKLCYNSDDKQILDKLMPFLYHGKYQNKN